MNKALLEKELHDLDTQIVQACRAEASDGSGSSSLEMPTWDPVLTVL